MRDKPKFQTGRRITVATESEMLTQNKYAFRFGEIQKVGYASRIMGGISPWTGMEMRVQVCGVGEGMGGIRHKLWKENMS